MFDTWNRKLVTYSALFGLPAAIGVIIGIIARSIAFGCLAGGGGLAISTFILVRVVSRRTDRVLRERDVPTEMFTWRDWTTAQLAGRPRVVRAVLSLRFLLILAAAFLICLFLRAYVAVFPLAVVWGLVSVARTVNRRLFLRSMLRPPMSD